MSTSVIVDSIISQTAIKSSTKALLYAETVLLIMLRIAADGLVDPVDVRWDTCDDALSTRAEHETVDANNSPRVLLIFACQWTSAITLTTQQCYIARFSSVWNITKGTRNATQRRARLKRSGTSKLRCRSRSSYRSVVYVWWCGFQQQMKARTMLLLLCLSLKGRNKQCVLVWFIACFENDWISRRKHDSEMHDNDQETSWM